MLSPKFRRLGSRLLAASVLAAALQPAFGAKILWVSDAPGGTTVPSPPFMGADLGLDLTDGGMVKLLIGAGHTVERYDNPSTGAELIPDADIAKINTFDLVIIGRAALSGQFNRGTIPDAPQQGYQWTVDITKPLICMSPYLVRPAMLGWFVAGNLPDNGAPAKATALDPSSPVTDYILRDVPMLGNESVDPFDAPIDRNTSFITDDVVPGGRVILQSTVVALGTNPDDIRTMQMLAEFPAGTLAGVVDDPTAQFPLPAYRMWLAGGSRESATAPQNEVSLYAGRENLTATGESIFLRAVEVALLSGNVPAVTTALAITRQPAATTVRQGAVARFDAAVSGPAPRALKWQRSADGTTFTDIANASTTFQTTAYLLPAVTTADNGARFRLVATSGANTVTSDAVTLTVQPDATVPALVSAGTINGATVDLYFDELIDTNDPALLDSANYKINGSSASVAGVTARPDSRSVVLSLTAPLTAASFTVNAANVADRQGNRIPAAGATATGGTLGLTSTSVGNLQPLELSSAFFRGSNGLDVTGGGLSLIHSATEFEDEFQFVHKTVTGDFDARVRVDGLAGDGRLETTAQAILTARESTEPTAVSFNVLVTPPAPGNDRIEATVRNIAGETTNQVGQISSPAGLPGGVWMRITRSGESLTAYRSSDGIQWTTIGSTDPAALPDLPDALEVGVGAASHLNGNTVTATFSNLSIQTGTVSEPIMITNAGFQGGTFSARFQTRAGVTYNVQSRDNLDSGNWAALGAAIAGDGTVKTFTDTPVSAAGRRFYRIAQP